VEKIALGLDLGGTYIKAGLLTQKGASLGAWKEPTRAAEGASTVMEGLLSVTRKILASDQLRQWQDSHNCEWAGIGIGSPGVIDPYAGVVRGATFNLPGWTGMEIGPIFESEFRMKTYLDNDANAYVWGEYLFGAGRGRNIQTLLGLTLGTGVGGGVIVDGRLLHGAHCCAGELGHIPISESDKGAPPCSCGAKGCIEAYVSAPAIARYASEQKDQYPGSRIFDLAGSKEVTSKIVHQAAVQNDPLALHVIQRTAAILGRALTGLIYSFDPELVILGGGVVNMGDLLLDKVRKGIQERFTFSSLYRLEIVPALLGSDGGYKGAAGLALFPSYRG